ALLLHEPVKVGRGQHALQLVVEHVARRAGQLCPRHQHVRLPFPLPTKRHPSQPLPIRRTANQPRPISSTGCYGTKKSAALELTSRLLNDDRDEDRDGPAGFESKAERARLFAAEMALQSYALLAAAEGALAAYADLIGEEWKPYEAPVAAAASIARKSAAAEMAAFQMT
nr:hypothetical protein [Rhodospirillales bacterium]